MGDVDTTRRTMTTPINLRVRKHRAKIRAMHYGRLETWIPMRVIRNMRLVAKGEELPMWAAVQRALETYVASHAACNGRPEPV